jgi:hypothetical protein
MKGSPYGEHTHCIGRIYERYKESGSVMCAGAKGCAAASETLSVLLFYFGPSVSITV